MRYALICFSLAVAALAGEGNSTAQAAPWCSTKDGLSCGYYTFQQCLDAIRGVGGNCAPNPHEPQSRGGAAPGYGRGATTREDPRAKQEQRARALEAQKAKQEQRARALEEQKAKAAKAREEQKAKPAPTAAEPAKPATPPPPPVAATPAPAPAAGGSARKSAPTDARVYFVGLKNGDEIASKVTILFGVEKMGVAPAGIDSPNTGHHHLLIDAKLPALDKPIPSDFNHLHFGAGQTEATVTLSPGKHTLQLLFADTDHVPHSPPVMSQPITVIVKAEPAKPAPVAEPAKPATPPPAAAAAAPAADASGRKAAPTDARVYFVGLQNGAEIPSKVTILFGVEKMGVAPAGIDNPNTGHHHLLIDTKMPALDKPIPSDFNHLHFGAGQTEATLTLSPGKHTLQLLFADTDHIPHNPPVMSQPITVTVKK